MKTNIDRNFEAEACEIIEGLKSSDKYAEDFFYKKISPITNKLYRTLSSCYKEYIDPAEIPAQLYLHMWSGGTWKPLDSYQFRSSFYSWFSVVATNEMFRYFDSLKYHRTRKAKPGNTRLCLLRKPHAIRQAVVELVHIAPLNEFLRLKYVEKRKASEIMMIMGLDSTGLKEITSTSENLLKEILLSTDSEYASVVLSFKNIPQQVGEKALRNVPAESMDEVLADFRSIMHDYLGINSKSPDYDQQVENFIVKHSDHIKPTNRFKNQAKFAEQELKSAMHFDIFIRRFVYNDKPEAIAKMYDIRRADVDRVRLRYERRFVEYLRGACNRKCV